MGTTEQQAEPGTGSSNSGTSKSGWRRFLEVAVPVAAFAIAAPFVVNGLAAAVNSGNSTASSTTVPSPAMPTSTTTVAPSIPPSITPDPTTTSAVAAPTTAAPVTVANVDPDADDRTIALASEIVDETPTTIADTSSATSTTSAESGHSHGSVHPEVPLTRQERAELGLQLLTAQEASTQFPTVADALAAGYAKVTGYVPLIGAHYIKWALMDGNFDITQPEMLLYDGTEPTSSIVGLSYYMFSDTEPSPFAGGNDLWHQHIGLCIKDGVVVGGESTSAADCAARGGTKANVGNGWMIHAWVVPGWDSPQGVFSPEHTGLTPELPTS